MQLMDLFGSKEEKVSNESILLDKEKILEILTKVNDELVIRNKYLDLTVYGGSALCLSVNFRGSTFDIDATSSDSLLLAECIKSLRLSKDLINEEISVYLSRNEDLVLYHSFSNLKVYLPSLEFLLAMKCRAVRDKDMGDIKNLCELLKIHTMEELKDNFVKYYSPIQFTKERVKKLKWIL